MKTVAKILVGSRLYGTSRLESDYDYIRIVLMEPDEVLLGKRKNTQNKEGDSDDKVFDLITLLHQMTAGQTWALECLFAPAENLIESTPLWNLIKQNKALFLSKNVDSFVGFAVSQARKYSMKGNRYNLLHEVISRLELGADPRHRLDHWVGLKDMMDELRPTYRDLIKFTTDEETNHTEMYLEVCGRKFQFGRKVGDILPSLKQALDGYGERSKEAAGAKGTDFKALSHALRVALEAERLLRDGCITFPLSECDYLRAIKNGVVSLNDIDINIANSLENIKKFKDSSNLPDKVDHAAVDKFITSILREYIVDSFKFETHWLRRI